MRSYYTLLTLGLVSGASECIGPIAPGLTSCGTCGDVRGTQCVSNGQWFGCFKSYEDCCSDWSIQNHQSNVDQCVKDSEALAAAPTETPLTAKLPTLKHSECAQYVALTDAHDNAHCMTSCDKLMDAGKNPTDDSTFKAECIHQHWTSVNGRTVVDDQCFEKWIYGYSQENNLSSFIQGLITETPAQCMYLCQITDDCINWAWLSELYANTGSEQVGRCMLKNQVMVEMAATIRTDSDPSPNMNTDYCNYGMPHQCMYGGYICLPCNGGEKRCVWESDMHVSGWKTCVHTDMCSPQASTLAPPMTPAAPSQATPAPTEAPASPAPTEAPATPAPTQAPPAPTQAPPAPSAPVTPASPATDFATQNPRPLEPTPAVVSPRTESATELVLDSQSSACVEELGHSCSDECAQKPDECSEKPTCREDCACRGEASCGCCGARRAQLVIRVADRPKKLHFDLEN